MGLDFNPTYFSHPKAESGFTLSSSDKGVRDFWIEHGKRCREIAEGFGKALGQPSVVNFWMPDGYKDVPADTAARPAADAGVTWTRSLPAGRWTLRWRKTRWNRSCSAWASRVYTVGSHEFMLSYALTRGLLYTLDAGHFHPTEVISAKISAILQFLPNLLLHVSRGIRWDSDHVITLDDELQNIMNEIVLNGYTDRVRIALDYFDASINRVAAWVIGMRNAQKALAARASDAPGQGA